MATTDYGISSGVRLGLQFSSLLEDKELKELQKKQIQRQLDLADKTDPLTVRKAEIDVESGEMGLEKSQVDLETAKFNKDMLTKYGENQILSDLAFKKSSTDFANSRASYYDAQTQGILTSQANAQMGTDGILFAQILEDAQKDGLTNFELNSLATMMDSIESPQLKAQLKNINAPYMAAAKPVIDALQMLQSGQDVQALPAGFNEGLTTILKPQTDTAYLGSAFIDGNRQGVVEEIVYDGNLIAKGRGDEMIMGANVTVRFGDTTETFQTFLPDRGVDNKFTFRSDLEPDDAKAVSVADTIDIVSSNFPLIQKIYQNPAILKNLQNVNQNLLDTYYPESRINEKEDQITFRSIFNAQNSQYLTLLASVGLDDIISNPDAMKDDSDQLQAAARVFNAAYGDASGIVEKDGVFVPADPNSSLLRAIFNNAPSMTKVRNSFSNSDESVSQINDRYKNDPDAKGPPVQQSFGESFPYDVTPAVVFETMINQFSNNPGAVAEIRNFDENFRQAVEDGDVQEEDYIFYLNDHLTKHFTRGG